jgi:hypothetical protein
MTNTDKRGSQNASVALTNAIHFQKLQLYQSIGRHCRLWLKHG